MLALVDKNGAVSALYAEGTDLNIPNFGRVVGASVGWSSPDGAWHLVNVVPFVVPQGQAISGSPTYVFDGKNAIETYPTTAIPPPPPVTTVSTSVLFGRLTAVEMQTIVKAANAQMVAGNPQYLFWLTTAKSAGFVDLASADTQAIVAAIVAAGVMTQNRANVVFTT